MFVQDIFTFSYFFLSFSTIFLTSEFFFQLVMDLDHQTSSFTAKNSTATWFSTSNTSFPFIRSRFNPQAFHRKLNKTSIPLACKFLHLKHRQEFFSAQGSFAERPSRDEANKRSEISNSNLKEFLPASIRSLHLKRSDVNGSLFSMLSKGAAVFLKTSLGTFTCLLVLFAPKTRYLYPLGLPRNEQK